MSDAPECTNETGTCNESGRGLTHDRSGFDLEELNSQLTGMRNRVGALTPAGHRCSNLMEMFDNLPPGPEDRIEYLTPDGTQEQRDNLLKSIARQTADLATLTNQ